MMADFSGSSPIAVPPQTLACIATHMDHILEHFRDGARITVMVRFDGRPERDFVLTSDDLTEAIAALQRRRNAGPT